MTDILSRLPELRGLLNRLDWSVGEQNSVAMTELAVMFSDGQLARALLDHIEGLEREIALREMLADDNRRMRAAGTLLAEAALRVVRTYDGCHRLALAVAEWAKAIADEGLRARAILTPAPGTEAPQRLTDHERMMKGDLR